MLARHPSEFLVYNGQPAWGVVVDNTDYAVLHRVRYLKAHKASFHHVHYLPYNILERMSNGEATFVWGDDRGISAFETPVPGIVEKVKEFYVQS